MKTINVDTVITDFRGNPVRDATGQPVTVKEALLNLVGMTRAATGKDAIRYAELGRRLLHSNGEWPVEDADLPLVQASIDANGPGYVVNVIAAVAQAVEG